MSNFKDLIKQDFFSNTTGRAYGIRGVLLACLFDPGFSCSFKIRLMHYFSKKSGAVSRFLTRIIWLRIISKHQCHISSKSHIGGGIVLPHPVGITIGEGVVIEEGVTIYQNTTIGRKNKKANCYPIIGRNSTLYAGCVVVGEGRTADNLVVGANSFHVVGSQYVEQQRSA